MASLDLDRIEVRSGGERRLADVTLSVPDGAFVCVVGGSGSGKSTLLRTIAGLERPAHGTVRLAGRDVTGEAPGTRDVAMVFQEPALLGHLSARRNVSFPLDVRSHDTEETRRRVDAEVRAMHIEELMGRSPGSLSVGERQMVQIARALVRVPSILLLDEPFAALDDALRRRLRAEIAMLQAGYGVTTVMTTNDPVDVEALATMVAVLDQGGLIQFDAADTVRNSPSTLFAAAATGPVSLIDVTVLAESSGYWLVREDPEGGERVRIRAWAPVLAHHVGRTVTMMVRPDDVVIAANGAVPARVERAVPWIDGGVRCSVAGVRITATADPDELSAGDHVGLRIDRYRLFDAATHAAIT
jgi:ABC-type sugar transport system ATPase subunit